jgi:hypothetical protein
MKLVEVIFYHIYKSYYKGGNYRNDIPHVTAFGIVSCSIIIIFITGFLTFLRLFTEQLVNKGLVISLFVFLSVVLFYFLLYKSKYKRIYTEIKGSRWDTVFFKILSWSVLVIAFLVATLYAYTFNR